MLVPLILWQKGLIQRPMFYISGWLEAHRDEYYDRLLAVSRDGDWTGWCAFFIEALRAQAELNLNRAQAIRTLYDELKLRLPELTRSQDAVRALEWILHVRFSAPPISSPLSGSLRLQSGDFSVSYKKKRCFATFGQAQVAALRFWPFRHS